MHVHRIRALEAYAHLIETDDALYLVDAGMTWHGRAILAYIGKLGRRTEELRLVVVTHGHADHYGGVATLQDAVDFDVLVHPSHAEIVRRGHTAISPGLNAFSRVYESFAQAFLPRAGLRGVRNVVEVADGERTDAWGLAGRVLFTPGHSTGDITLLLDDGSAFVGDTIQGPRIKGITRPELPNMALDTAEVLDSWQLLLDAGATTFYPGHGSVLTAEELRAALARELARL